MEYNHQTPVLTNWLAVLWLAFQDAYVAGRFLERYGDSIASGTEICNVAASAVWHTTRCNPRDVPMPITDAYDLPLDMVAGRNEWAVGGGVGGRNRSPVPHAEARFISGYEGRQKRRFGMDMRTCASDRVRGKPVANWYMARTRRWQLLVRM